MMDRDVLADLGAEQHRIEELLGGLDDPEWERPSACGGWSIADVVLHLAQTEEAVVASITGAGFEPPAVPGGTVDEMMDQWVASERGGGALEIYGRWRSARRSALEALREADPARAVQWAATPLKPRTLATTRLSEHWIHALDITEPLGLTWPDDDRLWHIARLAHRTLPYAYMRTGRSDPPTLHLDLTSPGGERWEFGPSDAGVAISGSAGEFCRIAARRLDPSHAASIGKSGQQADEVLSLIRTYA